MLAQLKTAAQFTGTVIPILEGVMIRMDAGSGTITTSDLSFWYCGNVTHETKGEIKCVAPIKQLVAALTIFPDACLEMDGQHLIVGGAKILTESVEDYPDYPDLKDIKPLSAPIHNIAKWCGKDEMRLAMTGVYIGSDAVCATDAHKLVEIKATNDCEGIIVPAKACGWEGDQFYSSFGSTHHYIVRTVNEEKIVRCIDARYPDYKQVIPDYTAKPKAGEKVIPTYTLCFADLDALTVPLIQSALRIVFSGSHMVAKDLDLGWEVAVPFVTPLRFGVNPAYLAECLKFVGKDVTWTTQENRALVAISGDITCLVMPVMVTDDAKEEIKAEKEEEEEEIEEEEEEEIEEEEIEEEEIEDDALAALEDALA